MHPGQVLVKYCIVMYCENEEEEEEEKRIKSILKGQLRSTTSMFLTVFNFTHSEWLTSFHVLYFHLVCALVLPYLFVLNVTRGWDKIQRNGLWTNLTA
jgi:hypothetical protein